MIVDFDRCLEILELDHCATPEEAHRAYRDLIRVWHPDRFSGDPRLSKKASEKVKELNIAYEELIRHLKKRVSCADRDDAHSDEKRTETFTSTEVAFEYGTRKILTFWHSLSKAVKVAVKEARDDLSEDNGGK